ncbi:MAG: hypothetical protein RXN77_02595 [Sulfolobaceae archaeon]|jgi:hypothetical protein|nr:hypothetical protein [Sulfolobales archaeon]
MASEKLLQAMRLVEEASRAYEEGDNFGVVIRAYRIVETLSQFLLYLTGHYVEANDLPNYLVLVKGWQKIEAFARKLVNLYRKLYLAYKVEESSLIGSVNIRGTEAKQLKEGLRSLVEEAYQIYDEYHN